MKDELVFRHSFSASSIILAFSSVFGGGAVLDRFDLNVKVIENKKFVPPVPDFSLRVHRDNGKIENCLLMFTLITKFCLQTLKLLNLITKIHYTL